MISAWFSYLSWLSSRISSTFTPLWPSSPGFSALIFSWSSRTSSVITYSRPCSNGSCRILVTSSVGDGNWGSWDFRTSLFVSYLEPEAGSSSSLPMAHRVIFWVFPVPWFGILWSGLGDSVLGSCGSIPVSALCRGVDRTAGLSILFISSGALLGPLGLHLRGAGVCSCAFFSRLFRAFKQGQTFPQVWQIFLFHVLCGLVGAAFFTPEPQEPFWPIPSSKLVTGSASGNVQLGWVLPSFGPSLGTPLSTWATPCKYSRLSVA